MVYHLFIPSSTYSTVVTVFQPSKPLLAGRTFLQVCRSRCWEGAGGKPEDSGTVQSRTWWWTWAAWAGRAAAQNPVPVRPSVDAPR